MPTEPFRDLLYRDLARVQAKEIIDVASPLLQEIVNFGTNAFMRCQAETTEGEQDEHVPVLTLYLHILEMTDAIEELVSNSCAYPAMSLLRSSFEALLSMDYILARDYGERASSWMVGYVHRRIASLELADPETKLGKEHSEASAKERPEGAPQPSDEENEAMAREARRQIEGLRSVLAQERYQATEAEYQKMSTKRRNVPWYSLLGGPSTLRGLAQSVNKLWGYLVLYGKWSTIAHAGDISRFLTQTPEGTAGLYPLRNPKELASVAFFGATFSLDATRLLIRKFRPRENLARWYRRDVQERFLGLQRMRVTIEGV